MQVKQSSEWLNASGYLLMLVPPALLAATVALRLPALAFVGLIVVAPFLRTVFGDAPEQVPEWSERVAAVLEALPVVAACAYLAAVGYALAALSGSPWAPAELTWFASSVWAVFIFGTCVSHELLHRSAQRLSRVLGQVLSGMVGYPLQEHEHRAHHARAGDVALAEWPALTETVWHFTARRIKRVFRTAWEGNVVTAARRGSRLGGGLPLAMAATVATALTFWLGAGTAGLVLYVAVAVLVGWTLQAMTYVQHWGLGTDSVPDAAVGEYGWEDRCKAQAWLTLNISFHQSHHHGHRVPYYRHRPTLRAPLQPAGYVVLLFACMVPAVWRALMGPALERWRHAPEAQLSAGRRLFCIVRKA